MKKHFLLMLTLIVYVKGFTQTISPVRTDPQCPGINITFSVSIAAKTINSITAKALNVPPVVIQQPSNVKINRSLQTCQNKYIVNQ